ncbi:23S rRNA (adenine(2503)-C(2))-methyltransferase RlmN [candidate division KSB1 bacterium]|nr:23S rRNA (adenine(2503)-C(2))-methyltransferase RlmN [candidate division KSB1 bacterium]NIR68675.1 23S rRNA (adenine(2503)-C(2))-methyltransferase RlmN [candidate division KSB1 bacterium]NIS27164.1 23S rRNA (adenine(2503)-C(2))-methyltransferase RlmN [candidate division KSB1 bacterium]NIT74050.1 23S rRNA (adenine(2503)-C(2))-methyltransferase RlmN [candidate division KSB1 bacterium]NIU27916.1 23S rRNA (adenine(2503)-C(2))-methyltransferase RlmN [candidate division KSB1 bacterium]
MQKRNLKGLNLEELRQFVEALGEKPYRAQQIFKWIYGHGSHSFDDMTNLSKEFRGKLAKHADIIQLQLLTSQESSKDNTVKFLFQLHDGLRIESVLMFDGHRTTLCISTQAGCALDCKFCATGKMGLQRHLTPGEIVDQLLLAQSLSKRAISNVVCMGMGEPFHNYDNLMKACSLLSHDVGPNLAKRHIVVSTSGLVPQIIRFADEGHKYRLAISLNATVDEVRSEIMPLNRKWPIAELMKAAKYYTQKADQPVTFEYVLMERVNDFPEDAERLKEVAQGMFCKINLIPYNATEGTFRRPSEARIMQFYERMTSLRAPVTIRWSKGDDIEAGCGQLATKSNRGPADRAL